MGGVGGGWVGGGGGGVRDLCVGGGVSVAGTQDLVNFGVRPVSQNNKGPVS